MILYLANINLQQDRHTARVSAHPEAPNNSPSPSSSAIPWRLRAAGQPEALRYPQACREIERLGRQLVEDPLPRLHVVKPAVERTDADVRVQRLEVRLILVREPEDVENLVNGRE